jgi:hypothetical protein
MFLLCLLHAFLNKKPRVSEVRKKTSSPHLSGIGTLTYRLVAGLHRACPSAALDKGLLSIRIITQLYPVANPQFSQIL